jgi:hypothetical protein
LLEVYGLVCLVSITLAVAAAYVSSKVAGDQWAEMVFFLLLVLPLFALVGNGMHVVRAGIAWPRAKRAARRNRYWAVEPTTPPVPIPAPGSILLSSDRDLIVQALVAAVISGSLVAAHWP